MTARTASTRRRSTLVDVELADDISAYYVEPAAPRRLDLGTGDTRAPLASIALTDIELSLTPFGAVPAAQVGALLACGSSCTGTLADRQAADPSGYSTATLGDLLARLPLPALPRRLVSARSCAGSSTPN